MLKLLTLKGELTGSAVLDTAENGTKIELRCRGGRSALQPFSPIAVFIITASGVLRAELSGAEGRASSAQALGLIIADRSGRIIAEGSGGLSPDALERARTAVRIKLAEDSCALKTDPKNEEPAQSTSPKRAFPDAVPKRADVSAGRAIKASSPVTERILDSAKALFGREAPPPAPSAEQNMMENEIMSAPPTNENEMPISIRNPFPKLLPGAKWRLCRDGVTLEGEATIRGAGRMLAAAPVGETLPELSQGDRRMRIRGRDGKIYNVIIKKRRG